MPSPPQPRFSDQILARMRERFPRCAADPGLGRALTERALAAFGLYTGWEIFHAFLLARLPPGDYLFAGTGPAFAGLAAALLDPASPIRIAGFVDPRASRGDHLGRPVLTPAAAARTGLPGVIVCAAGLEQDLLAAGVAPARLHCPLRAEGFRAFHDAMLEHDLAGRILAEIRAGRPEVRHVILVPNGDLWMVVEEAALREVLAPERTIRLYYGPPGKLDPSPHYPTWDMGQSLPLLLRILAGLAPASVHVRGSAQFKSGHVAAAVRASFPDLFLAFEVYDYAAMLDDVFLETWGCTPELAEDIRDAEGYLGRAADFILDKTPGAAWEAAARELVQAPRRAYFPTLGTRREEPGPPAPRAPGPLRLLCAGSMPHFKNYRPGAGFPHWAYQDIIEPLVRLAREADFHVDLFNASHDPRLDHGPAFEGYAALFPPERIAYHARIPVQEVQARAPGYDFGMFLFAASEVIIDFPLQESLPNRCMSYIAGDLPLIVNAEMRCLAALVQAFDAGIVVASTEIESLPGRIRAADLPALRRGAAALHRHLVERNREALQALAQALSEHEQRVR